jgi:peptide chain release factor 2
MALELNAQFNRIKDYTQRTDAIKAYLRFDEQKEDLQEVTLELEQPDIWNNPTKAQELGKKRAALEAVVNTIEDLDGNLEACAELLEMAEGESDEEAANEVIS